MSPALPLTPPHTPAASLTPSSSIHSAPSTDSDFDPDADNTRFILVTHIPRDADTDSIKRVFTSLIRPNSSSSITFTDPIKGMFIRLQKSEGKIVIAFYDSRKASAVVAATAEADAQVRLSVLLGGNPPPGIQCRLVSITELEKLIGKSPFVDNNNGGFVVSLERTTAAELPDSESLASARAILAQYGDIRSFVAVDDSHHADPKTQVIHVEFYDVRDARAASTAVNGLVVAGSKIRIFGQPEDLDDDAQDDHHAGKYCARRENDIDRAHTTKKNCIPFPKSPIDGVGRDGDEEVDGSFQNAIHLTKQRPRSASAGTSTTDSARQALTAASPVFISSSQGSPAATRVDPKSNEHSHTIQGPAQIHDVFGRRCSNQLLFDAAKRPVVQLRPIPQPTVDAHSMEPERSRRSLSIDARGVGAATVSGQAVKETEEGCLGVDDGYIAARQAHAHTPPYAYPPHHQQQLQYYFPSHSPVSASNTAVGGSREAFLQPLAPSFYGPSLPLHFAPPPGQMSPPTSFTGYEYDYDVHNQHHPHPGFHIPTLTRTDASSNTGPVWALDHAMAQEHWYGGGMSGATAGYYSAPHQHSYPMRHHHHTQQLVHPYTLRCGQPQAFLGQESFGLYAYPTASCPSPTSPISLQPGMTGMGLGAVPPQFSLQIPGVPMGVQIPPMPVPVQVEMGARTGLTMQMPSPGHETDMELSGVGTTCANGGVGTAAGTGAERNQLNLARIADGQDTRTTVMIKNIPNKMSDKDLLAYIWRVCPRKLDFLYLRMDFRNECNVGYAFVNFIYVEDLLKFARARLDVKWNLFSSEKILHMSYANYQGKEALIEKFKNSCIMDEREAWRPKIFYSEPGPNQGLPEPFPPPTHFRRKERSSHNRGALFVPGITGGAHRQDRQHGAGQGHNKRVVQGLVNHGGAAGIEQQTMNPNYKAHKQARRHDEDKVECEGRDQGDERMFQSGTGARSGHDSEPKDEQTSHAGRGVSGPSMCSTPRYERSDHRLSWK